MKRALVFNEQAFKFVSEKRKIKDGDNDVELIGFKTKIYHLCDGKMHYISIEKSWEDNEGGILDESVITEKVCGCDNKCMLRWKEMK